MSSISICILLIVCFGSCAAVVAIPTFASLDPSGATHRVRTLDGLRGLLALAVVVHHGLVYRQYLRTGEWIGMSGPCNLLGSCGVALFFMITGYLFWSRLIAQRGRMDWSAFYLGRVFRIGPVFLLAAAGALLFTLALNPVRTVGWDELIGQIVPYAFLGAAKLHAVNGVPTPMFLANVVWTLRYEWAFYAALPVLAVAARRTNWHLFVSLAILAAGLAVLPSMTDAFEARTITCSAILFSIGMVTASLQAHGWGRRRVAAGGSLACLLILGVIAVTCTTAYTRPTLLALGAVFFLVTSGSTLFGVLTSRPILRLGEISYGIYLLQGLVLTAMLRPAPMRAWAVASPLGHGGLVAAASVILVLIATAAHLCIERPGIRLGRRVVAWTASRPFAVLSPQGLEPR